jgi:hypothetical protein
MHTLNTAMHNAEIRNAFAFLLGNGHIKTQKDVWVKLGFKKPGYTSDILNGKVKASEEFCARFEKNFLACLKPAKTLADFRRAVKVRPQLSDGTREEVTTGQLVWIDMQNEVIIEMLAEVLSYHKNESAASIRKKAFEKVREKIAQIQGEETGR